MHLQTVENNNKCVCNITFSKILIIKILKILREYLFKYLDDNLEALQISFLKYELYYNSRILLKR